MYANNDKHAVKNKVVNDFFKRKSDVIKYRDIDIRYAY